MQLSDLNAPTLRVVAAAIECRIRYGCLGMGTVSKIARAEPGASVDDALAFLGFPERYLQPKP